jgi:hypothetical protein
MELPGSNYLFNLAVISITFAGFSTVAIVFRQVQGAGLSEYETVFLRLFLTSGLITAVFSIIPPLLGLFSITPSLVWRISSFALALVILWREIFWMHRRLQVRPGPLPRRTVFLFAFSVVPILGLLINAIGIPFEPNAGLYAQGATWLLVNAIVGFIMILDIFLKPPEKG